MLYRFIKLQGANCTFVIIDSSTNSDNKSDRNLSIKVLGKKVIDINTDDVIETGDKISKPVTEVDGEDTNSENS